MALNQDDMQVLAGIIVGAVEAHLQPVRESVQEIKARSSTEVVPDSVQGQLDAWERAIERERTRTTMLTVITAIVASEALESDRLAVLTDFLERFDMQTEEVPDRLRDAANDLSHGFAKALRSLRSK